MADTRPDIKVQIVRGSERFTHYDFTGEGYRGKEHGDLHATIGEIDEDSPDALRQETIAFFDENGDRINRFLDRFVVFGARLQVRKYDE